MKKIFMFSMVLALGIFVQGFAMAAGTTGSEIVPTDTLMPGMIESTGTHFEINNSDYLNIVLDSSESITLRLESIPEMVTMHVEPASDAASTQISVSGFQPSTKYYQYEDNYHNLNEFTTDGSGSYSWTQDLNQSHLVFIQPRKSTKFIADNATGGDCYLIGTWDSATKTCTLTTDLNETIQIDSNYITLDGNGHTLTGSGTGYGVYLSVGDIIKNFNVTGFTFGIYLSNANNTLTNNTISNNFIGVFLYSSNSINNTLTNNAISNNLHGIFSNYYSNNNTFTDNNVSNNLYGIYLQLSNSTTLTDNAISDNKTGIYLWGSSNNTLTGNIISNNDRGIDLSVYSNSNTLTDNTIFNNSYGIFFFYSSNNQIFYNNNLINNQTQAYFIESGGIFNLEKPTGGNYWSNFDTPEEGCSDADYDGFCDSPYYLGSLGYFGYGVDYLPWTTQDGWKKPTMESLITLISQLLQSGGIDNAGIANSLLSKLNNALTATNNGNGQASDDIMQAFINQVSAQAGQHISADAAAILINAATYIINN
ncbi:MAG: right-handed parallel beta-helix repeat-containing protein [Nitrospirae bacterium]|nr:right-handed parallel beta-helix repeat-containing protein [Nitrospirota bacterium]